MLKGWVLKYRDRYRGDFQVFPSISVRLRVQKNPNIALDISRTPANDVSTSTVATI